MGVWWLGHHGSMIHQNVLAGPSMFHGILTVINIRLIQSLINPLGEGFKKLRCAVKREK